MNMERGPADRKPARPTRRHVLGSLAAGAAAAAFPTIVPSRALGLDGAVAPSERITLGVIGIGPRCTYVLKSMLGLADVRCLAIADVQASRRDAGKALVDTHYGNADCRLHRDFRDLLARKDRPPGAASPARPRRRRRTAARRSSHSDAGAARRGRGCGR